MIMMAIITALATIELAWNVFLSVLNPPYFLVQVDELLDIFGLVMIVIIGIELLETLKKTYHTQGELHFEVVLSVAVIAIARKVIILDIKAVDSLTLFGIASIIFSLTVGYYFMKKSYQDSNSQRE
jgi:uncharacterized membrane protein (DUF373 family)